MKLLKIQADEDSVIFNANLAVKRHIDAAYRSVFSQLDAIDAALEKGIKVKHAVSGTKIRAAMNNLISSARLTGFQHASGVTGKRMPVAYGKELRARAEKRSDRVNGMMLRTTKRRYRSKPDSDYTFSEGRALAAAKYEAARAYYRGVRDGFEGSSDFEKAWLTSSENPCEECMDAEDQGYIGTDEDFVNGEGYPPNHLRCQCLITTRILR